MSPHESPRLLFVHAHPDDETLTTGGTIAHYAARSAEVHLVTCTLGEEGEVIGERYAQLAVDHADQLGGYRIAELTAALQALGLAGPTYPRYLGGAGHWRDSGMAGTPSRGRRRWVDADLDEAVGELVAVIGEVRPHVVVTYDPNGGYGHPDHIQTHVVTTRAVAAAPDAVGWTVPKFYWTVTAGSAIASGLQALDDVPAEWIRVNPEDIPFGFADDRIDAVVDVTDVLPAKVAAMRAHATQITVAPNGRSFALSNNIVLPVAGEEHYVLVSGEPGPRDARGWETDLLAGLDLE
jgi:N-acetyl-1-D-myo-inositol-2-amino-2-deoxy-alpha-D-glucopyranoside deacetylase